MSVEDILKDFRDEHGITCAESLYQRDELAAKCIELVEELLNEIGYHKEEFVVLVCGGRNFGKLNVPGDEDDIKRAKDEAAFFFKTMESVCRQYTNKNIKIVHGGASGADTMADTYAKMYSLPLDVYKADWDRYKKRAGIIRNQQMLEEASPNLVVAFPGGNGTAHMVKISKKSGVEVRDERAKISS